MISTYLAKIELAPKDLLEGTKVFMLSDWAKVYAVFWLEEDFVAHLQKFELKKIRALPPD